MKGAYLRYFLVLVALTEVTCLYIHKSSKKMQQGMPRHVFKNDFSHQNDQGHYNSNSAPDSNQILPNWLSKIDNSTLVSMLSIPGTHDSGTYTCSWYQVCDSSQCQSWDITNQLQAGIRYLDVRINSRDGYLAVGHGPYQFLTLTDFFSQVATFLRSYPIEFVILAFQKNSGDRDPAAEIITLLQTVGINAVYQQSIPTVGSLRGKAWIFGGIGVDFYAADHNKNTYVMTGNQGITDTPYIYIQNEYQVYSVTVSSKINLVMTTANLACSSTRMKVNFLSGSGWVLPFWFAKMDGGPNQSLDAYLQSHPGKRCLGITIMDYPGTRLINQIVSSN